MQLAFLFALSSRLLRIGRIYISRNYDFGALPEAFDAPDAAWLLRSFM
jgi:hypothetical protein